MKALVVGAAGNIGSALVPALTKRGHSVVALIHSPKQRERIEGPGVEVVVGDLSDLKNMEHIADGIDVVFHLIGYLFAPRRSQIIDRNVTAAENITEFCLNAGIKRIIFSSSVLVYSRDVPLPAAEDEPVGAETAYGQAKIHIEKYLMSLADKGLVPTIIRVGHVYGKGVSAVEEFKYYIKKGWYRTAGKADHLIPPVFVGDLVEAMVLAAETESAAGQIFNVNDDEPMPLKQFSDLIAKELGKKPVKSIPGWLFNIIALLNEGISFFSNKRPLFDLDTVKLMQTAHWGDNSKAKEVLGWQPRYKSFREGIKECF